MICLSCDLDHDLSDMSDLSGLSDLSDMSDLSDQSDRSGLSDMSDLLPDYSIGLHEAAWVAVVHRGGCPNHTLRSCVYQRSVVIL